MRNSQIFQFGAKGPLEPTFIPGVKITLKIIAAVQVSPYPPILWGFARNLQNFEFGAKGPLDPKFGPKDQITLKMISEV